jgi:two-component system sensor histidine kinase UhpB
MSIRRAILKWVDVPAADPDDARRRRLLNVLLLGSAVLGCLTISTTLAGVAAGWEINAESLRLIGVSLLGLAGVAVNYVINRRWNVWVGGTLFLSFLIVLTSIVDEPRQVIEGRTMFLFTVPIFMASILLRPWTSFVAAGVSGIVVSALVLTQSHRVPPIPSILGFFLVALAAWVGARSLERALKNLRLSEQRYHSIFDAAQDAFLVFSTDGIIREANPAACTLHGYSHDELIGLPGKDIVHPDDHHLFEEFLKTTKAGGSFYATATDVRRDGSVFNVNVLGAPYTFDREPYLLAVVRDTTEQKHAENLILAQRDLALALSRASGLDETLNLCLDAAIGSAKMDGGGIYLVDATGGLNLTIYKGLSPEFAGATAYYDADSPNAQLVMAGEPVYVSYQELGVPLSEIELGEGLHAIAVVPVRHEGKVIACLNVASRSLSQIPVTARNMLETIAGQVGGILARAQTEEVLQQRDAHQALVLRSVPMAFYTAHPGGDYGGTWASEQIYQISGFTAEQFVIDSSLWASRLHPEDRDRVLAEFDSLSDKKSLAVEYRWQTAEGRYLWILDQAALIEDEAGTPREIVGTWLDITERREMERKVRRLLSQQIAINQLALALGQSGDLTAIYRIVHKHVRELMDVSAFVVSLYDREAQLIYAGYFATDDRVLDISGFPPIPLEPPGHGTQSRVIHSGQPLYVPDWRKAMELTLTEHKVDREEGTVTEGAPEPETQEESTNSAIFVPMMIEGETIGVMQVQSLQLDAFGQEDVDLLAGLANVAAVAIYRTQAEEALRKSEERYALAMDATTDGLFDWHMQTGEAYFSPRWYTMLGYEPDEIPASYETWLDLLHPDDREHTIGVIAQYNEGTRISHEIETRLRAKSGEWRWILSRGKIIERDPDGSPTRMVGTHVDVTERKRLETERRQATEALRALYQRVENVREEERRRLAKALHDDVMQRLVGVVYEVYNIDGVTDEDVNRVSEVVSEVGTRCRAIVHNLYPPELDWPLAEAVRALPVGDIFLKIIPRVNPAIEEALPGSTKLIAYRVIQEAVNNAVKHAGALEITISLWLMDRHKLRFEIRDNGCGFDPDTARKEGHFGLTFMREHIEMVDGDLQVQSQPGSGTRVTAVIPFSAAETS